MPDNLGVKDAAAQPQSLYSSFESSVHKMGHLLVAGIKGGSSIYRTLDAQSTGVNVKASAGNLYGWSVFNASASKRYLKLYNKATAPTVGTDTPVLTIPLLNGATTVFQTPCGIYFSLGIGIGCTTGLADNDTGAPTTNDVIVDLFFY